MEDILEELEVMRKHYCTGPCGQSVFLVDLRNRHNRLFREAMEEIRTLREQLNQLEQDNPL